jgi:hypothetical protein
MLRRIPAERHAAVARRRPRERGGRGGLVFEKARTFQEFQKELQYEIEIVEVSYFGAVPMNTVKAATLRWTPPALRLHWVRMACFPPNTSMRPERALWRFVPSVVAVGKHRKVCVAHRSKFECPTSGMGLVSRNKAGPHAEAQLHE